jgi:hypothetical protein
MKPNKLLHTKALNMVLGVGVGVYPYRIGDTLHHRTVIHIPISHHYTATQQRRKYQTPISIPNGIQCFRNDQNRPEIIAHD